MVFYNLADEIKAYTPSILVTGDETTVDLVCNFYGYLPTDKLSWYRQTQPEPGDDNESITEVVLGIRQVLDEARLSQTGGEQPGLGRQSILTISSPTVEDTGRYYCAFPSHLSVNATIDLVISPIPVQPLGVYFIHDIYVLVSNKDACIFSSIPSLIGPPNNLIIHLVQNWGWAYSIGGLIV